MAFEKDSPRKIFAPPDDGSLPGAHPPPHSNAHFQPAVSQVFNLPGSTISGALEDAGRAHGVVRPFAGLFGLGLAPVAVPAPKVGGQGLPELT